MDGLGNLGEDVLQKVKEGVHARLMSWPESTVRSGGVENPGTVAKMMT